MTDFALRTDDGDVHPEQVAYVDGYGFGDRLLEGVRFKVEVISNGEGLSELVCTGVHEDDKAYVAKFSGEQMRAWYPCAVLWLTDEDGDATAEDGTNVHWGDA